MAWPSFPCICPEPLHRICPAHVARRGPVGPSWRLLIRQSSFSADHTCPRTNHVPANARGRSRPARSGPSLYSRLVPVFPLLLADNQLPGMQGGIIPATGTCVSLPRFPLRDLDSDPCVLKSKVGPSLGWSMSRAAGIGIYLVLYRFRSFGLASHRLSLGWTGGIGGSIWTSERE